MIEISKKLWIPIILTLLALPFANPASARGATTDLITSSPTYSSSAGDVRLGDVWIFENSDQAGSVFQAVYDYYITVTIYSNGIKFQTPPSSANLADYVEPLPTLAATNKIQPGDLTINGTSQKTYTVRVRPTNDAGTRSGLVFHFPVNISGAEEGPIDIEITAPNTGITSLRTGGGNIYGGHNDGQDDTKNETPVDTTPAGELPAAVFVIGQAGYTLDGVARTMDAVPYIKEGRIFLPLCYAAPALGIDSGNISWNAAEQKVTLTKGEKVLQLTIGSPVMLVDGATVNLDAAPEISRNRTCLPLAALARALGASVSWDPAARTVTVK